MSKRSHHPSLEEMRKTLGPAYALWERLTGFVEMQYEIEGAWSTWGPANFGWGLRYRIRSKALVALYPQEGWIIAQVVLGREQAERVLGLQLGEVVGKIVREAPQLRDGRWLSIPVRDDADAKDVERLLLVKMPPVGRAG